MPMLSAESTNTKLTKMSLDLEVGGRIAEDMVIAGCVTTDPPLCLSFTTSY
jgi:hypothetical protein